MAVKKTKKNKGGIAGKPHITRRDMLIERMIDLHKQAETEKSHYYTANLLKEAIVEIIYLRDTLRYMANHGR